jgi:hypothetical protein
MTAYNGEYKAVEPAPDSPLHASTGPVVPVEEAYKAKGAEAVAAIEAENDDNSEVDEDVVVYDDSEADDDDESDEDEDN